MKLVVIEWVDSRQPAAHWQHLKDVETPRTVQCTSCGWLMHDGEDEKAIVQNLADPYGNDPQVSGLMVIPTKAILRMVEMGWTTTTQTKWDQR